MEGALSLPPSIDDWLAEDHPARVVDEVANRRLERARADLADALPTDDINVTSTALRWGFGHLGRFAAQYRARFGESPSRTLRG